MSLVVCSRDGWSIDHSLKKQYCKPVCGRLVLDLSNRDDIRHHAKREQGARLVRAQGGCKISKIAEDEDDE